MKKVLIILIFISICFACHGPSSNERKWKENEIKISEIRCGRDKLIAKEELKRGNIIAYFNKIDPNYFSEYQYYLFIKYNIICRTNDANFFDCQKSIMDSVIQSRFGKNFYTRIEDEIKVYFYGRSDNLTPEGYYFTRGTSHFKGGLDSLYSIIDKLIPNIREYHIDSTLTKDADVLIYIDTIGRVSNVMMKKRLCPELDERIINAFRTLPDRFEVPLVNNRKYPIIEEIYLKW